MLKYIGTIFIAIVLGTILYITVISSPENNTKSHSSNILDKINRFDSIVKFVGLCWLLPGPSCHILTTNSQLPEADLFVKVTGKKWAWQFDYKDRNSKPISLPQIAYSVNTKKNQMIILPLGKNIHLTILSIDVIHTWSVPKFSISADAIPGRVHTINLNPEKLGDFKGNCSEYCGKQHDKMTFTVRVVPYATFKKWQSEAQK